MRLIVAGFSLFVALLLGAIEVRSQDSETSSHVYVMGNVCKPSGVVLVMGMRLRDALDLVGGVRRNSSKVRVAHYRIISGRSERTFVAKLKTLKKQANQNVLLQPYDIIDVSDEEGSFGHPSGRPRLNVILPSAQPR